MLAKILLIVFIFLILYCYILYNIILALLSYIVNNKMVAFGNYLPQYVSIIITAHNEEAVINKRILNLRALDYPDDQFEIIVASDGSTDRTVEIAMQHHGVIVLDLKPNRGKATTQNDAVKVAKGEIIFFTDAETEFKADFLKNVLRAFSKPNVGCVVGNLIYRQNNNAISYSEGFYWNFEKGLRKLESTLGILSTASGACMAVKKNLWRELSPIDDSDFTTPLDVIQQGQKVVFALEAVAYDIPSSTIKGEFRTRVRQTSKNLIGIMKRWRWTGLVNYPLVSWGIISHKILRWLTPFFLLGILLSNLALMGEGIGYQLLLMVQAIFYLSAAMGLIAELYGKKIPVASLTLSFCVANMGMGIGIIKGVCGKAPHAYRKEE